MCCVVYYGTTIGRNGRAGSPCGARAHPADYIILIVNVNYLFCRETCRRIDAAAVAQILMGTSVPDSRQFVSFCDNVFETHFYTCPSVRRLREFDCQKTYCIICGCVWLSVQCSGHNLRRFSSLSVRFSMGPGKCLSLESATECLKLPCINSITRNVHALRKCRVNLARDGKIFPR